MQYTSTTSQHSATETAKGYLCSILYDGYRFRINEESYLKHSFLFLTLKTCVVSIHYKKRKAMHTFTNVGFIYCFALSGLHVSCILFKRVCICLYRFAYNIRMAICIIIKVIAFVPVVIIYAVILLGECCCIITGLTYIHWI